MTRMTPGVRIGSIAASGLADLPLPVFVRGLVIGNTIFVTAHFGLGFALGASATSVLGGGVPAALIALVIGLLAVAGAVGWTAMRARGRARSVARSGPFPGWAEAACPACLAVTTFRDEPGG